MHELDETTTAFELERTLWLQVGLHGQVSLFELRPEDDRAIVVGAGVRAHLRIDRPGVAPIEFNFEREGFEIFVAPGYQADLRVNAAPVRTRSRLPPTALIEFHGIELDVRVLDQRPESGSLPFEELGTTEHVRSYLLELDLDAQTVRVSVPGMNPPPELPTSTVALETRVMERKPETNGAGLEAPPLLEQTLALEPIAAPALPGPRSAEVPPLPTDDVFFRTQALGSPHLAEPVVAVTPAPAPAPIVPQACVGIAAAPALVTSPRNSWSFPETTPADPSVSRAPVAPSQSLDQETTIFEDVTPPSPATPLPESGAVRRQPARMNVSASTPSWLARLGLLTKARPVPTVLGALGVALVLGGAVANLSRFVAPARAPAVPKSNASVEMRPELTRTPPSSPGPTKKESPVALTRAPAGPIEPMPTPRPQPKRRKGAPQNPELIEAVTDLSAGRYAEASRAYQRLSKGSPAPGTFEALGRLLERASSPACKPSDGPKPSCPEVLR